jgi:CpXC protein
MPKATRTTIQCPNCGQPINAVVESLINANDDPEAKARLLTGRTNSVQCPACGVVSTVAAPILYHDGGKELLISYMPMELNLPKPQQEKVIGDLMRELTSSIPKESIRGYLFQPRQALTMQGLVDQILQADGVTPEMMEAQRATIRLVETMLQATDAALPALIQQHDAEIKGPFFQAIMVMAQRAMQEGRSDLAERLLMVQNRVAELSTFGKELIAQSQMQEEVVREVAQAIDNLGRQAQRSDVLNLVIQYAGDEQRLQALVGLARPALDYGFFQELTQRIGQAPAAERDALETLRERLVELTAIIDQQSQMVLQNAVKLLQAIANSPNPDELIRANLDMIDDTFMAVLSANIEEAEKRGDVNSGARLKQIYQRAVTALQANMQPELLFVNELLSTETDEEARKMIAERVDEYGDEILDVMDAVGQILAQHGDTSMIQKLAFLRQAAMKELAR